MISAAQAKACLQAAETILAISATMNPGVTYGEAIDAAVLFLLPDPEPADPTPSPEPVQ